MMPIDLMEDLKKDVSPKIRKTLDAIYSVCEDQLSRGASDFSYTTIARLGAGMGVPRAQTIRNRTGSRYQALIKSFSEQAGAQNRRPINRHKDSWIDEIKDAKLRLLVSIQQSELIEARRLIRQLIPPSMTIRVDDRTVDGVCHRLSDSERHALEFLVSDEFFSEWKFKEGKRGEVIDSTGARILKPGTLPAIKKALEYL